LLFLKISKLTSLVSGCQQVSVGNYNSGLEGSSLLDVLQGSSRNVTEIEPVINETGQFGTEENISLK
jgi:hypothetical protein